MQDAGRPGPVHGQRAMDQLQIAHVTQRFRALRDIRLGRLRDMLPPRRREVLDLLPLLFHLNHPHLPAFIGDDVPAGLPGYVPERDTQLAARKHLRDQSLSNAAHHSFVLRGMYLMGSSGTLGQDRDSDFDVWLIHDENLSVEALARLQAKSRAVEAWASAQGAEVHIFLMHAAGFRGGQKDALSNDSSGQTQHILLLEEFYRTAVLLAGRPPLWWLIPPGQDADYAAQLHYLQDRQGLHLEDWIDFGALGEIPADEFFSSAHWQLHKGIDAPYKSILKLMLTESYAAQYPQVRWLSEQLKQVVYGEQELDPDRLDPYRMILDRLSEHLTARGEPDRLELARRSLYVKTGIKLTSGQAHPDWRAEQLRRLSEQWGWDERHWQLLDSRRHWKLERVMDERDALVAELTRSYRLLTEFARAKGSNMSRNGRELSLLGRRLYAALERRPGKVELINPGISQDLAEEQLWICRHASGAHSGHWRLYRQPPGVLGTEATPLKTAGSLVEMLAWLYINGLAGTGSHIQLLPRPVESASPEHLRILQVLERRLTDAADQHVPISAFADTAQALHSLAFVNVAPLPMLELQVPIGIAPTTRAAIDSIDHLVITSWGEILVRSRDDGLHGLLDVLCQHLNMTRFGQARGTPLFAHAFSSGEADAVARRITELGEAISDTFSELGEQARCIFELQGSYYLIEQGEQGPRWIEVGDREDLMQLLQEPQTRFRPVRLDPRKLSDSPLVRLYAENLEGVVQVFFRAQVDGIEMFCLDDCGALFHQHYPNISEPVFLSQQRRLFDSLANRRLLASTDLASDMLAGDARFYRLAINPEGWTTLAVEPPKDAPAQPLELLLVTSGDGLGDNHFTLVVDRHEFDALGLGGRLYQEVAAHILARRKPGQDYPIRVTGVLPAGLEDGSGWSVNEMLRAKRRIERRLTQAMHELSRQRPGSPAARRG